jgi:hypothetical protein
MLYTADISKIFVKWYEIASKLKINIINRLSVTDYPCPDPYVESFGVDFMTLGKRRITSERNKVARSASHRSKENNFRYRMVTLEVEIKWEMFSEYRTHHFIEG